MDIVRLTNKQARRLILLRQGLLGAYRFSGREGVLQFIRQAGCIQYDPIDICGKNAELTLQSRVRGFKKNMLYDLLYQKRELVDYFDKNMAIFPTADWPCFARMRRRFKERGYSQAEVEEVADEIRAAIAQKGCVSSADLHMKQQVDWSWSPTTLSRAALETLYFRGELILHHKKGTVKYYALAEDYIPGQILRAPDPNPTQGEFLKWRILRRIGAVGLLWNKPSDAWLGIGDLTAEGRNAAFAALLEEGKIMETQVEGISAPLYCLTEEFPFIEKIVAGARFKNRVELLAPLDNMLWDRRLIKALFNFDYKWEIYTPVKERKYGYYVLPLLAGDELIGRVEPVCDKKGRTLQIKNVWFEDDRKAQKWREGFCDCIGRFAAFNGCEKVVWEDGVASDLR